MYDHNKIEPKWQHVWDRNETFKAANFSRKKKFYGLVEFPYPSGSGMHVGHMRAFLGLEIVSRKRRMQGFNVMFPIGFDSFGLPAENYAIKNNVHPKIITEENIKNFKSQLKRMGFSFDWSREIRTSDPDYYKWTQWIFTKLFSKGLAYKDKTKVNYCPSCKVVLSNEDSQGGKCDRCETEVIQKEKEVWFLKITDFADELIEGLKEVEASDQIKKSQIEWIGKSEGAEINFNIDGTDETVTVFTTRPDTIFGVTNLVLAPEHPLVEKFKNKANNTTKIDRYVKVSINKTELERKENKEKTAVVMNGVLAVHPITMTKMPVYIADYVLNSYGTGAIMSVPGHDSRDEEMAEVLGIPPIKVIEDGVMINSRFLDGMTVDEAIKVIIEYLEMWNVGKAKSEYKMRDWAFNRQRYWGEPIPLIHCPKCGTVPVPKKDLPVKLPNLKEFKPGEDGQSPLAKIPCFVNTRCPECGAKAKRETDTMPQWAGSSWYYLRYMDPNNKKELADRIKRSYWESVDWYNGGMEHVTRHLIYSRFWHKFLKTINSVYKSEPYLKRTAQGIILGSDGQKMSKSKKNTVDPMNFVKTYGADALRLYILFMGEYSQTTKWEDNGIKGTRKFLEKLYSLRNKLTEQSVEEYQHELHTTMYMVNNDIEDMKFNTAIAKLMTLVNFMTKINKINRADYEYLLQLVFPFAPHICEELWQKIGHKNHMSYSKWPHPDERKMKVSNITIPISINGKVRDTLTVSSKATKDDILKLAKNSNKIKSKLGGIPIVKEIYVPGKIVNLITRKINK